MPTVGFDNLTLVGTEELKFEAPKSCSKYYYS